MLVTNHTNASPAALVTRYAQRMLIENNISESIRFFHLDALSSMVGLKVDFDLQLTLMAGSLYRLMAQRIGREYVRARPKRLFRNLLDLSARVDIEPTRESQFGSPASGSFRDRCRVRRAPSRRSTPATRSTIAVVLLAVLPLEAWLPTTTAARAMAPSASA